MERDREREPHRTYIESEPERKGARLRWTGEKGEKERETMHIRERSAGRGPCARRHHSGRVRAHCGEGVAPPEGWGHRAHAHAHASQWGTKQEGRGSVEMGMGARGRRRVILKVIVLFGLERKGGGGGVFILFFAKKQTQGNN